MDEKEAPSLLDFTFPSTRSNFCLNNSSTITFVCNIHFSLQDLDTRLLFPQNRHFSTQLDVCRLQGLEMPCLVMEFVPHEIQYSPFLLLLFCIGEEEGTLGSSEV
jgi:hypothetical protein